MRTPKNLTCRTKSVGPEGTKPAKQPRRTTRGQRFSRKIIACDNCRKSKVACDGQDRDFGTCRRCEKKGSKCEYGERVLGGMTITTENCNQKQSKRVEYNAASRALFQEQGPPSSFSQEVNPNTSNSLPPMARESISSSPHTSITTDLDNLNLSSFREHESSSSSPLTFGGTNPNNSKSSLLAQEPSSTSPQTHRDLNLKVPRSSLHQSRKRAFKSSKLLNSSNFPIPTSSSGSRAPGLPTPSASPDRDDDSTSPFLPGETYSLPDIIPSVGQSTSSSSRAHPAVSLDHQGGFDDDASRYEKQRISEDIPHETHPTRLVAKKEEHLIIFEESFSNLLNTPCFYTTAKMPELEYGISAYGKTGAQGHSVQIRVMEMGQPYHTFDRVELERLPSPVDIVVKMFEGDQGFGFCLEKPMVLVESLHITIDVYPYTCLPSSFGMDLRPDLEITARTTAVEARGGP